MSGIEVAGLVLAVFPIVIKGLKQFTEGLETIKDWKRYYRELARYSRTLEIQQVIYLNTMELLFDGIIQSKDEFEAFIEDPGHAVSCNPQYEKQLRMRLDRSYDNYIKIMVNLLDAFKAARKELGIDNGKILWNDYSFLERHLKRLKLTLFKNVYADLVSQIKEANVQLKEFTKDGHTLESNRKRRRSKHQSVDFKFIRRQAKSLYNVMVTGRSWKCGCGKYHVASLLLEPRPWEEDKGKDSAAGAQRLKFRVLLFKSCQGDGLDVRWMWREIEIEPVEASDCQIENDTKQPSIATLSLITSSTPPAKKKEVNFADTAAPKSTGLPPAIGSAYAGMSRINNLCAAVYQQYGVKQGIGFLTDESVGQNRHHVYLVDEKVRQGFDPKSLECLLQVPKRRGDFSLSRRDRLYISVTLASSVLQLDGTSWLKRQWRSGDIFFLPLEDRTTPTPRVDFTHPYVSWRVWPEDTNIALVADASGTTIPERIPSVVLFALGITLTELCFGKNICDMRIDEDIDWNTEDIDKRELLTSFNTATRLINHVYNESGNRYGDVVRRCLQKCPPDLRDASLDNEEFQKVVFESIVTPLRQDFEDFNGGSRIR